MSLNPEDFKTLDIKVSSDKTTVEVTLEAHPNGRDIHDEKSGVYLPNPNYKKWRPQAVLDYLKSKGHNVEKHLGGTSKVVTNGDDRLKSTMRFQLKKRTTKPKTSKNEKPEPVAETKPKPRAKRSTPRRAKQQ